MTAPESNRRIIEELKKRTEEHEDKYGRFPKTLIFACNDLPHTSHADQLVRLCREVYGRGDSFVQKITGSPTVDRPLQRIREFRNRPYPGIVVTVDMLSTGVDIPALDATRRWRAWQADKAQIEKIEAEEVRLDLRAKVKQAMTRARLFGGAAMRSRVTPAW